ncbi:hypothetical protein [Rurimicrobium arvi]|uniref:Uncharacterized protein n=1 Tax=Rurimicrobium arvi TaxID=2049916 RepID=A0ABP8MDD5_9BACT
MLNRKRNILLSGLLALCLSAAAQQPERKVIVDNGRFFYFTVDEETQLAHMHSADTKRRFAEADDLLIPAGRSTEDPQNPLCFSLRGDQLITINWILNSNNSRYDAIRKIDLRNWRKSRPDWDIAAWAEASFVQPVIAPNEPWEQLLRDNNVLTGTYFDLNAPDSNHLIMTVCNNRQLRVCRWDGLKWSVAAPIPCPFDTCFSVIYNNGSVALVDAYGSAYRYDAKRNQLKKLRKSTATTVVLVEDHDSGKTYLIPAQSLNSTNPRSFESVMQESAQEITF